MTRSTIPGSVQAALALCLTSALILPPALAQEPTLAWSDHHDGGAGQHDEGIAVLFGADGNPIVGGIRTAVSGRSQILIRKLDRHDGSMLWTHISGDPHGNDLFLTDLVLDHRGDLLVAGYLSSCAG